MLSHLPGRSALWLLLASTILLVVACDLVPENSSEGSDEPFNFEDCTIPTGRLVSATQKDAIPALTNPALAEPGDRDTRYLADDDRVIGLLFGETPLAVPHNILWHHEIVNFDDWAGRTLAVTYCPLTGSSLAFDRDEVDGAEFGVSGLLFNNNLVLYDRQVEESLWPQMNRKANCGAQSGESLKMLPVIEMRWERWKTLYPNTKVLSSKTGYDWDYTASGYPYGNYERVNNDRLLYKMPIDDRRPPKERVLGIPSGPDAGLALPFGALDDDAPVRVLKVAVGESKKTVFWNRQARSAMAFETSASFSVVDGRIVDDETGSTWTVDGRAVEGPRTGDRLELVEEAYVAFWFAWAAFQPETRLF